MIVWLTKNPLGLDPAGLLFRGDKKPATEKLDTDDADFVEVIHTNMGQLGLDGKIGHADFYPVSMQKLNKNIWKMRIHVKSKMNNI